MTTFATTQNTNLRIKKLAIAGMLVAVGILVPMFSPIRVLIEPASFTLASHAVIFIAMFISPLMAVAVAVGTTIGFQLGGFPLIIVLRAATHVVFAFLGSYYLHRVAAKPLSFVSARVFSFVVGLIHAVGEVVVVSVFFFGGNINPMSLEQGFFTSVLLLIGVGSVIHSMVDFEIARLVVLPLKRHRSLASLFKV